MSEKKKMNETTGVTVEGLFQHDSDSWELALEIDDSLTIGDNLYKHLNESFDALLEEFTDDFTDSYACYDEKKNGICVHFNNEPFLFFPLSDLFGVYTEHEMFEKEMYLQAAVNLRALADEIEKAGNAG